MSDTNEKVTGLFRDAIPALVDIVVSGRASSARIRFTDPNGPTYSNFWWIEVDTHVADGQRKIYARTNDIDLMVGIPPSFHKSVVEGGESELVEAAIAFLTEKLGKAVRVDILLQADAAQGQAGIANHVGNSDDGFAKISEQTGSDVF
jgi:hypothetical protein